MSEFRRDAKYKINVQKLVSPLYTQWTITNSNERDHIQYQQYIWNTYRYICKTYTLKIIENSWE